MPKIPGFVKTAVVGGVVLLSLSAFAVVVKSLATDQALSALEAAEHGKAKAAAEEATSHDHEEPAPAPTAKAKPVEKAAAKHAAAESELARDADHAPTARPAVRGVAPRERVPASHSAKSAEVPEPAKATPRGSALAATAHQDNANDSFSVNDLWADLAAGNARFVAGRPQAKEILSRRAELAQGQHPQVIVVGCADSRCIPEMIFDKNLGELFVVRTAGNVADPVALGSIEYAAEHLHAKVLVVLGHSKCGAVAAAAAGGKLPSPNLEAIVAKIAPALEDLRSTASGDELVRQGVSANVHQSADDIVKNSRLIRGEVMSGQLRIIKAIYNIETGVVERLP